MANSVYPLRPSSEASKLRLETIKLTQCRMTYSKCYFVRGPVVDFVIKMYFMIEVHSLDFPFCVFMMLAPQWQELSNICYWLPPNPSSWPLFHNPPSLYNPHGPPTPVTVQIYLSRCATPTGTRGSAPASAIVARSAASLCQSPESIKARMARKRAAARVPPVRKTPSVSFQLRKTGNQSAHYGLNTPSYRGPIKSPSQYFQICY